MTAFSNPKSGHAISPERYAGWIPTANGRLSFRHIGETRNPEPSAAVSNFRVTVLAVLAPTLALIGVALQPQIGGVDNLREFPTLNHAARFISTYAMEVLGFSVLFATSAIAIQFIAASISKRDSFSRQMLAIGIANQRAALLASLTAAVVSAGLGIYFGWSSLTAVLEIFRGLSAR